MLEFVQDKDYTIQEREPAVTLLPGDRNKCAFIADMIVIQCIIVTIGSMSILYCVWTPENAILDFDKLARIMYLFDYQTCDYKVNRVKLVTNLLISNETYGRNVWPIRWQPAIVTVSTRLSAKTRKYIEKSLVFHIIWFVLAIAFRYVTRNSTDVWTLKVTLAIFFYCGIFIICFDASMAVVYINHIQQSLTKEMIVRHSGWSTEIVLASYDDFAGWLPMAASVCWLRGFIFFFMNIYFCRIISILRKKVKKREVRKKFPNLRFVPIPEPQQVPAYDDNCLVFRLGERKPQNLRKKLLLHI